MQIWQHVKIVKPACLIVTARGANAVYTVTVVMIVKIVWIVKVAKIVLIAMIVIAALMCMIREINNILLATTSVKITKNFNKSVMKNTLKLYERV